MVRTKFVSDANVSCAPFDKDVYITSSCNVSFICVQRCSANCCLALAGALTFFENPACAALFVCTTKGRVILISAPTRMWTHLVKVCLRDVHSMLCSTKGGPAAKLLVHLFGIRRVQHLSCNDVFNPLFLSKCKEHIATTAVH